MGYSGSLHTISSRLPFTTHRLRVLLHLWIRFPATRTIEGHTDRIDTMPLVGWCGVVLALENVAQMATTVAADDLSPRQSHGAVGNPLHGPGYRIEVRRPAATRFELMVCPVELGFASNAFLLMRKVSEAFESFGHRWASIDIHILLRWACAYRMNHHTVPQSFPLL